MKETTNQNPDGYIAVKFMGPSGTEKIARGIMERIGIPVNPETLQNQAMLDDGEIICIGNAISGIATRMQAEDFEAMVSDAFEMLGIDEGAMIFSDPLQAAPSQQ